MFLLVNINEKENEEMDDSPEKKKAKKAKEETSGSHMTPAKFSSWMQDKMSLTEEKQKMIKELEEKLHAGKN